MQINEAVFRAVTSRRGSTERRRGKRNRQKNEERPRSTGRAAALLEGQLPLGVAALCASLAPCEHGLNVGQ